jgi:predicted aldo/keto reductase-like oxidoreductase
VEGCLHRLKTDYIDILMIHDVSHPGPIKDPAIMEAMSMVKEQGKTRFIGTATHSNMTTAIRATVEADIYDVILTSVNFTMADDTALLGAIENAAEKGLGLIAMKTQAGGRAFPHADTVRDYSAAVVNSAALKWVCHNRHIATSIPGMATYEHLRTDFAVALNPEYTDQEKRFLADHGLKLGMEFCRQCRYCMTRCPRNADVPALMRTHMYARQYADFDRARETLDSILPERGLVACRSCTVCRATCAHSVNIARKISELKLIYALDPGRRAYA